MLIFKIRKNGKHWLIKKQICYYFKDSHVLDLLQKRNDMWCESHERQKHEWCHTSAVTTNGFTVLQEMNHLKHIIWLQRVIVTGKLLGWSFFSTESRQSSLQSKTRRHRSSEHRTVLNFLVPQPYYLWPVDMVRHFKVFSTWYYELWLGGAWLLDSD